ncbi:DNA-directed RNA polymerase subunit beta [Microcella humidisoli]|uniref:DNA-directed RNA polymerase subunit beta n=1 Tax=Microcella humidisoli TaxID=2963406 RepID=A0ABY5FZ08_9MICO|nr:DNA-directed RNA polymerase subunit beta [Microcella humidisoli]UTT63152.1 DNA-directed RNA polymerase subunit beta [Microcella humidisoli]
MTDRPMRPVRRPSSAFDALEGGLDPAVALRIAHDSARALVHRVRSSDDPDLVERMVAFTDEHGLDTLAELWSRAGARTLPGALWRLSLLRALIRQDPAGTALLFQRGSEVLSTADVVVAGAESPTGPDEIRVLADAVLRGVYDGDVAVAFDRAAAFCRTAAAGAADLADDADAAADDARAAELTARAARLTSSGRDFTACAALERAGSLD